MWARNEIRALQELKRTCMVHMLLQSGSAYLNYILHNCITLPNITLGAVTSVSIFSTTDSRWRIASGVMAIGATVLTGLGRHLGSGEKAQLHASVTKQYHGIICDINTKCLMDVDSADRMRFIEHVKTEIDRLVSIQPEPSLWVVRRFEKKYNSYLANMLSPDFGNLEEHFMQAAERISKRVSSHHNTRSMYRGRSTRFVSAMYMSSESPKEGPDDLGV
jgi:hypothetical protein